MPRKVAEKNYALEIRRNMRRLGIYKEEYESAIVNLARMQKQYDALDKRFEEDGYPFEVATEQGSKKAPIVTTLESLRKDILAYLNALGLTPQGAKRLEISPAKAEDGDPLTAALAKLGGDGAWTS